MRRARWKRKNVRRVGLRRRRPPAAGGGWLAVPCRSQGRKRPALGETSGPGKLGIPSASLPAAAYAPVKNSQRQRKEKQRQYDNRPDNLRTICHLCYSFRCIRRTEQRCSVPGDFVIKIYYSDHSGSIPAVPFCRGRCCVECVLDL